MTTLADYQVPADEQVQGSPGQRATSARSYAILISALAVWSVTVIMIFVEVLGWPYTGARFFADVEGQSARIIEVREGSPAKAAGLAAGDRVAPVRWVLTRKVVGALDFHGSDPYECPPSVAESRRSVRQDGALTIRRTVL